MFFFFVFIFSSSPALPFCTSSWNLFLCPLNLVNSGSVYFYMCILAYTAHPPCPALTSLAQLRPASSALCWMQTAECPHRHLILYFFTLQGLHISLRYLSQLLRTVALVRSKPWSSPFFL